MRVLTCQVHNVGRVKDISLDLAGHHLFIIGGKNGQGKTSGGINALLAALCGKKAMGTDYPDPLLRDGETEGSIRIQLSGHEELHEAVGFTVDLRLQRNTRTGVVTESLVVTEADRKKVAGEKAPAPRTFLKDLFDLKGFDPLVFDRMDRQGRRAMLMRLVDLDLTDFQERREKIAEQRKDVGRDGTVLAAKFDSMPENEAGLELRTATDLIAEIEAGTAANKTRTDLAKAGLKHAEAAAATSREVDKIDKQMAELALQRQALSDAWAKSLDSAREANDALGATVVCDLTEAKERLATVEEINALVRQNIDRQAVGEELKAVREKYAEFNKQIKDLEAEQDKAVAAAPWPIPGMSVDSQGVLLGGLAYEVASQSQRIVASAGIGAALNPKLRLLVSQHGSDLDLETMAQLESWLRENDFQMVIEVVTRTEADEELCQVVIVDGEVKANKTTKE